MHQAGGLLIYEDWTEAQTARMAAWEQGAKSFDMMFYCGELLGEVGETANILKKLHREAEGVPGSRSSVELLTDELADCFICLRNLSIKLDVPITVGSSLGSLDVLPNPSNHSVRLGTWVGSICEYVELKLINSNENVGYINERLTVRMGLLHEALHHTVEAYCDATKFEQHMRDKWNATSLKNGFPHRMESLV